MAWVSNYIIRKQWDVISHTCPNFNGGLTKSCTTNYTPPETNDLITNLYHNNLNLCWKKGPRSVSIKNARYVFFICLMIGKIDSNIADDVWISLITKINDTLQHGPVLSRHVSLNSPNGQPWLAYKIMGVYFQFKYYLCFTECNAFCHFVL